MVVKTKLLVKGHIQDVGYRVRVKLIARRMGVLGVIRNLPNGQAEILCECKNEKQLDDFINKIWIKAEENDYYSPNVAHIEKIIDDREAKETAFGLFDIDYGDIEPAQKEIITKLDMGSIIVTEKFNYLDKSYGKFLEKLLEKFEKIKYD